MRKILFRGKSENDGHWVEGSLVITTIEPADDAPIKHYHIEDMTIGVFPNEFQSGLSETVDPETVGQFTGLTDKNGKKIFEGDIVRYMNKETMVVSYCNESASFVGTYSAVNFNYCASLMSASLYLEVIGNIHDNPELLEVNVDG